MSGPRAFSWIAIALVRADSASCRRQKALLHRQGPVELGLGLLQPTLFEQHDSQVVDRQLPGLRVGGGIESPEAGPEQRLRLRPLAPVIGEHRPAAHHCRDVRGVGGQRGAQQPLRLAEDRVGLVVAPHLYVDVADGAQEAAAGRGLVLEPGGEVSQAAVEEIRRGDLVRPPRARPRGVEQADQEARHLPGLGERLLGRGGLQAGPQLPEGETGGAEREPDQGHHGGDRGRPVAPSEP